MQYETMSMLQTMSKLVLREVLTRSQHEVVASKSSNGCYCYFHRSYRSYHDFRRSFHRSFHRNHRCYRNHHRRHHESLHLILHEMACYLQVVSGFHF